MEYGYFRRECQKTKIGKKIFLLWIDGKLPLTWAMDLFTIYRKRYGI